MSNQSDADASNGELSGRTILVTGGTTGIGLAIATEAYAAGANVVVTGRDAARGAGAAGQLGPRALFVEQDAVDENGWHHVLDVLLARFGQLHGVVNNVGGSGMMANIPDVSPEMFTQICRLNVRATLLGMQNGYAAMRGNSDGGAIVNIASIASLYVHPMACAYCSSKAMLPALSRGAAREFARDRVRVNSIYPGIISSEMAERDFERKGNKAAFLALVPMRRLGEADEMATLARFLVSDRSRAITGADFVADGGKTVL